MRLFLILVLCWTTADIHSQELLDWSDLSKGISWETPAPGTNFPEFQKAAFSQKIKALEGKRVVLTGYLLVLDGKQSVYLLSKNPMASCFFCGNGGPETVVDLQFAKKTSFKMDDLLSVEGTLRLNGDNPDACYYGMENANAIRFKY